MVRRDAFVARRPAGVLLVRFVGDALVGESDELGERSMGPTAAARQRRYEAADRRPWVAIQGPEIDGRRLRGSVPPLQLVSKRPSGWPTRTTRRRLGRAAVPEHHARPLSVSLTA